MSPTPPAGARIDRAIRSLGGQGAGRDLGGDLGAGASAGVDEALALQPLERLGVERQPFGLVDHLPVPFEAEPEQVLDDPVDMLGPGPPRIDILDAQQEGAALLAREIVREQRRISVAQMQPAGRRRGEAGDCVHEEP